MLDPVTHRWTVRALTFGHGDPGGRSLALAMLDYFAGLDDAYVPAYRLQGRLEHANAVDKNRRRRGIPGVWDEPARMPG